MAVWSDSEKTKYRQNHAAVMPVPQSRHNYIHGDIKAYFDAIFDTDCPDYKGMVAVAERDTATHEMKTVAVVPATQLGDWAAQMHVSKRLDYYYGRAQHSGNGTWGCDGVFAYNALYVDLDAHDATTDLCSPAYVGGLLQTILPDYGKLVPNYAICSGRGLHLVWLINQVPAALGWMVHAVTKSYAQAVTTVLSDYGVTGYQVDMSYAANIAGLTRIPGTYNTHARTYATLEKLHSLRMDLAEEYDSSKTETTAPSAHTNHHSMTNAQRIGSKRLASLLALSEIRPIVEGYRDKYALHLFCAAQMSGLDNTAALSVVQDANERYDYPLPQRELSRYLSTAARKHYRYCNATIIDELDITIEDQKAIGLSVGAKRDSNRARKVRNAAKKASRDRQIMRLYLAGLSASAIAARVGHAYNTVRKIIAQFADNLSTLFTHAELQHLLRQIAPKIVAALKKSTDNVAFQFSKHYILCLYALGTKHNPSTYASPLLGSNGAKLRAPPLPVSTGTPVFLEEKRGTPEPSGTSVLGGKVQNPGAPRDPRLRGEGRGTPEAPGTPS